MSYERLVHDRLTDTWSFRGTHTGKLTLLGENENMSLLAIHEAGHSYFGGTGRPQLYAPAKLHIYSYIRKTITGEEVCYDTPSVKGDIVCPARPEPKRKKK